jgi:hypothetical protein
VDHRLDALFGEPGGPFFDPGIDNLLGFAVGGSRHDATSS